MAQGDLFKRFDRTRRQGRKTGLHNHVWELIAVGRSSGMTYYRCAQCGQYKDAKDALYNRAEFARIVALHRLFEPNSNVRLRRF